MTTRSPRWKHILLLSAVVTSGLVSTAQADGVRCGGVRQPSCAALAIPAQANKNVLPVRNPVQGVGTFRR